MKEIASKSDKYSDAVKKAFKDAYDELNAEDLTLDNLYEIKHMLED